MRGRLLIYMFIFFSSFRLFAENGNMFIHGELVEEPCALNMDSANQTVSLGTIFDKSLYYHERSQTFSFSIVLENCDISINDTVNIAFTGNADLILPNLFAINGTAKGIAVGLEMIGDKQIQPIQANTSIHRYQLSNGKNILSFNAYVQAQDRNLEKHTIVEGNFSTVVNIMLSYP